MSRSAPKNGVRIIGYLPLLTALCCFCSPSDPSRDGGAETDSDLDGDTSHDGDIADSDEPDAPEPFCRGNGDLVIERAEAVAMVGASLLYQVNATGTNPAVDLVGTVEEEIRIWDFSALLPEDARVEEVVLDPRDFWFAEHFDGASYATVVPGFDGAVGVYRSTAEDVALLGIASLDDDSTLVIYEAPPRVVLFPLEVGRTWTEESRATGRIGHVAFNAIESYTFTVDAAGLAMVPAGTYPTVRVRTELDRHDSGPFDDHRISYAWLAECWGRIAYVGSQAGERALEFTAAEQFWRLTLR